MCEKILDCGHQCPLLCQEPCTTEACKHQVELNSITLPCGHHLKGECNLRYAGIIIFYFILLWSLKLYVFSDQEVIEAKKLEAGQCHFPCPAELVCGHRCLSRCNECETNQFHAICNQPCKNLLVCGHKYVILNCYYCSVLLNDKLFIFGRCEGKCGKVCAPCKKPCGYQCSHQMCSALCGDDCLPCEVTFFLFYF